MSTALVNGDVSFWWKSIGRDSTRPALPGSTQADVCIIGAGYTGLWTAYYIKKAAPSCGSLCWSNASQGHRDRIPLVSNSL